jgi:ssDNA-binding Zn-finger/Zn-ribbon topoisomerase 1
MSAETVEAKPIDCPECGAPMLLRRGEFRLFFGCTRWPLCDGTHGAHPDGTPLGVPGNAETKAARRKAHDALAKIERMIGKRAAYKWLATVLHLDKDACHIGMFDKEMCAKVEGAVATYTRGRDR